MTFEEVFKALSANKPKVTATQQKLLERRYNLEPKLDPKAKCRAASRWSWGRRRNCLRTTLDGTGKP